MGDKHSAEVQFACAFLEKYNKSQVLTRPRKDEQELSKDNKTKQKTPKGDGNLEERVLWGFLFVLIFREFFCVVLAALELALLPRLALN